MGKIGNFFNGVLKTFGLCRRSELEEAKRVAPPGIIVFKGEFPIVPDPAKIYYKSEDKGCYIYTEENGWRLLYNLDPDYLAKENICSGNFAMREPDPYSVETIPGAKLHEEASVPAVEEEPIEEKKEEASEEIEKPHRRRRRRRRRHSNSDRPRTILSSRQNIATLKDPFEEGI